MGVSVEVGALMWDRRDDLLEGPRLNAQLGELIMAKPKVSCVVIEEGDNGGIPHPVMAKVCVLKIQACTAPQTSYQCAAAALARGRLNTCESCTFIYPC